MKDNYAFRSSTFMRALLVLLFMAVSIQWGFAQLNLNVSRGTLGTVIEQIKSQSKYQFFPIIYFNVLILILSVYILFQ